MLARRLTTILPAMTLAEAIETTRIHRVAGLTGDRSSPAWSVMGRVWPHFPQLAHPHEDLPREFQALWTHGSKHDPLTTRGQHPIMSPGTMRREWMAGAMSTIVRGTMSTRRAGRSSFGARGKHHWRRSGRVGAESHPCVSDLQAIRTDMSSEH
jgi:hypothetical protein